MEGEKRSFEDVMSQIGKGLDTRTVFGEPEVVDGSAIIPVAKVEYGGGGGAGGGQAVPKPGQSAEEAQAAGAGEGMGMGFGVVAKPLGVIQVKHDAVTWVPVIDTNRVIAMWSVIGGIALVFLARALAKR